MKIIICIKFLVYLWSINTKLNDINEINKIDIPMQFILSYSDFSIKSSISLKAFFKTL